MRTLVTGASGVLGGYVLRELGSRRWPVAAWTGRRAWDVGEVRARPVDLRDRDAVVCAFAEARPDAVLHLAARSSVADCHRDPAAARAVNAAGTALLADLAERTRARLVHVSTDLVFDGEEAPYAESATPAPLSVYGRTKREGELALAGRPRQLTVRVSLLYGPSLGGSRGSFFDTQCQALRRGGPLPLFVDEWRTPLDLPTAAQALVALAASDVEGVLHLGGPERLSRWEMGRRLAAVLDLDSSSLVAAPRAAVPAAEPRPRDVSLDSSRCRGLFPQLPWPGFEEAVRGMLHS